MSGWSDTTTRALTLSDIDEMFASLRDGPVPRKPTPVLMYPRDYDFEVEYLPEFRSKHERARLDPWFTRGLAYRAWYRDRGVPRFGLPPWSPGPPIPFPKETP
jgi:hypothetical protein